MRCLYAFRMARFYILRLCCKLAIRSAKWTEEDDKRLFRLMRYMHPTLSHRQLCSVGDDQHFPSFNIYTDADFAGDATSQRSTSGVHLTAEGPHSNIPVQGISNKQTPQGLSTPEVEIVAACCGYCKVGIPAMDL